jgi:3-hydroxybutyryl-CoA dehydrogenase
MHFWNPPHLVPLVEIVNGEKTSEATAKLLLDLGRRLGKKPILLRRDIPGFVGNRLQFAVLREALHLLAAGVASAEDIDTAMSAGPGVRYGLLGPLRIADLGGLDVFLAISQYLFGELSSERLPPKILSDLVNRGRLGAKSGRGFYEYAAGEGQRLVTERDRRLIGFLRVLGQDRR